MMICPKCRTEAVKVIDRTPGDLRAYFKCACQYPQFPLYKAQQAK